MWPNAFKDALNAAFNPIVYTVLGVLLFLGMMIGYRWWTKPKVALGILSGMTLFMIISWPDPNFRKIVTKPDNVPIVALLFILGFYCWWALRQAAIYRTLVKDDLDLEPNPAVQALAERLRHEALLAANPSLTPAQP